MNEGTKVRSHTVTLNERRLAHLTGIVEVESFDENTIYLKTTAGLLSISGEELSIIKLATDIGEMDIKGVVYGLNYSEESIENKKSTSALSRLFGR
jgi:sporulation protein YabP